MEKELCPECGNKTVTDYGENGKICGYCMTWTYEIRTKYKCIKTFITNYGDFKRYYYGEIIDAKTYYMLTPQDQKFFEKIK